MERIVAQQEANTLHKADGIAPDGFPYYSVPVARRTPAIARGQRGEYLLLVRPNRRRADEAELVRHLVARPPGAKPGVESNDGLVRFVVVRRKEDNVAR